MSKKVRKKVTADKYNFGSFVTNNQQAITGAGNFIGQAVGGGAGSAISGAASGAAMGAFAGPIGMGIGGALGLVGGIIGAGKKKRAEEAAEKEQQQVIMSNARIGFNTGIDTVNENPYGVYAQGGDVALPSINIELGELQIDPTTGKVLREFKGINPETGGKYQEHATGRKKDTKDNLVTAEEGTFIITKAKAKDYKESIDNNDKLHQNAILQNIRNKKKDLTAKFKEGGRVNVDNLAGISLPFNASPISFTTPSTLALPNIAGQPALMAPVNNNNNGVNWRNGVNNAIDLAPSLLNIVQGNQTPDYLNNVTTPVNPYRNEALSNLPNEINMQPLINRSYRDRNAAYNQIDNTTSSSAIGRANKANINANMDRNIQESFFQGEAMNNQIRGQRSSIYNQLGEADRNAEFSNQQVNNNINLTNRQMKEGRRQQVNYGLSQLQQLSQATRTNTQLAEKDAMRERILKEMFPALSPYLSGILGGGTNG